jgi:hypothetical protein
MDKGFHHLTEQKEARTRCSRRHLFRCGGKTRIRLSEHQLRITIPACEEIGLAQSILGVCKPGLVIRPVRQLHRFLSGNDRLIRRSVEIQRSRPDRDRRQPPALISDFL